MSEGFCSQVWVTSALCLTMSPLPPSDCQGLSCRECPTDAEFLCGFMCLLFCWRRRFVQFPFICFVFRLRPGQSPTLYVAYAGSCISLAVITGTDHPRCLVCPMVLFYSVLLILLSSVFETEPYHITQADLDLTILLPQLRTIGVSHHSLFARFLCGRLLRAFVCMPGRQREVTASYFILQSVSKYVFLQKDKVM